MSYPEIEFVTCDRLRELFNECRDDIDKRILLLDVRKPADYQASHLCLDHRNSMSAIRRKMRVINVDPDLIQICTAKNIMLMLDPDDLNIFHKRRDATDVIIIDTNTNDINAIKDPHSKIMRIINALTKFDSQLNDKIVVPIHVLKGGFCEWSIKYPHFTTNPFHQPETQPTSAKSVASTSSHSSNISTLSKASLPTPQFEPEIYKPPLTQLVNLTVSAKSKPPNPLRPSVPKPNLINKDVSSPMQTKNAPGTAVPLTPLFNFRSTLPRSYSSPNVAQQEVEDFDNRPLDSDIGDDPSNVLNNQVKTIPQISSSYTPAAIYNHSSPKPLLVSKPKFDRSLKPSFNVESVNAIKSQINFGRCPEASGKVITGLQNLGNTCFMNSVLQCLAYAPALVRYFCSDSYYNHINFNSKYGSNGEIAIEFGSLVEKLNSHVHRYIEPKSFRDAIVKHIGFAGCEQQDSHEFMMMLFDKLHHDLNQSSTDQESNGYSNNEEDSINIPRATLGYKFWKRHLEQNKSIISETFEGIFMSTLTCTACEGQSNTFEVFNCLSLPIPTETRCHLKDCLKHFSRPERIEAAWECPRCKQKREAIKKIVICKLPKILIIHLKRFSLDGRWRQKLQTTVDFPLSDLNVEYVNVLPQSAYGSVSTRDTYNLYAVANHYGHLDGGHYTAYGKLEDKLSARWYSFDDSNVTEIKELDVCAQSAYLLFYILSQ